MNNVLFLRAMYREFEKYINFCFKKRNIIRVADECSLFCCFEKKYLYLNKFEKTVILYCKPQNYGTVMKQLIYMYNYLNRNHSQIETSFITNERYLLNISDK